MFNFNDYFSSRFKGVSNMVPDSSYPSESRISPFDVDAAKVMFPLNEESGNIIDLLTRLMRTENQLERQQLLGLLNDNSADSLFAKVDDATKLSLLKPRSLQSFDEIAAFRDVCQNAIKQLNGADGTDGTAGTAGPAGSAGADGTDGTARTAGPDGTAGTVAN